MAPVPALVAARRGHGFAIGAAAGLIGALANTLYYWGVAGPGIAILVAVTQALSNGLATALAARALRTGRGTLAVFVYPLAMAATGFLATLGSPGGTAGSLAYSQMEFLPALQVASLGGAPAIIFLVMLGASTAALAVLRRPGWQAGVLAGGVITASALGWGAWRATPAPGPGMPVALLATDRFPGVNKDFAAIQAAYWPAMDAAAAAGARAIVLPEKILLATPANLPTIAAALREKSRATGATLVMGVLTVHPDGGKTNDALVARPDGASLTYTKQHLVPGWEATQTPGHTPLMLPAPDTHVGVAICKDMDFAPLGRAYGTLGARLMLVPAWDFSDWWGADGYAHGRLAVLRGVEGGFAVARAARQGILTLSDRTGRVLAEAPTGYGMASLLAVAPTGGAATLYSRVGDVFGYLCCGLGVIAWLGRKVFFF